MPIYKKTSPSIAKCFLFFLLFYGGVRMTAQSPVKLQITYPIYLEDVAFPHQHNPAKPPIGELCGVALLFLDTAKVQDEIIVTNLEDPVIWIDKAGISTVARFVVPDSSGAFSLELRFANGICAVNFLSGDTPIANGILTQERGIYKIRMVGSQSAHHRILGLLETLNTHLLKLHTKAQKTIPIGHRYNSETVNVILGPDQSYDTNFDLLWFDGSLLERVKELADNAHFSALKTPGAPALEESTVNQALVRHQVVLVPGQSHVTKGKVSTLFKVQPGTGHLFLRPNQEYLIEVGYRFEKWPFGEGRFMVDQFTVKNMGNGDFVSMDVLDFNWNGLPILYVDLIKGVVMEDEGAWKADQVLAVVQEVFRLVVFN